MDKSNEEEAIPIGAMDVPPLIATVGHMPDGSGTLQAERSRHEEGRRKNRIRVAVDSSGWACGECHEVLVSQEGRPNRNTSSCGSDPQSSFSYGRSSRNARVRAPLSRSARV